MNDIKFTIPEPCHEDWHKMSAHEQGRFCLACQKNVVDFSRMTDTEAFKFVMRGDGNMCGRFSAEQMVHGIRPAPNTRSSRHALVLGFLLPAFMVTKPTNAQVGKIVPSHIVSKPVSKQKMVFPFTDNSFSVSGRLMDEATREVIGYGSVALAGTGDGTAVNDSGHFELKGHTKTGSTILRISAIGYETKEIEIAIPANDFSLRGEVFYLSKKSVRLDEVTVYASSSKLATVGAFAMVVTAKNFREFPKRVLTALTDSIRIFPNPAVSGSVCNVALKLKAPGNYNLQITDASGRIVAQKGFQAMLKRHDEAVRCEGSWTPGVYTLRVIDSHFHVNSVTKFMVN